MDVSVFITRIFALYYLVIGAGLLLNPKTLKNVIDDLATNPGFLFYSGLASLVVGTVLVLTHNIWVARWTVIVTVIGWLALAKGVSTIIFPDVAMKTAKFFLKKKNASTIYALLVFLFGVVLFWLGFFVG